MTTKPKTRKAAEKANALGVAADIKIEKPKESSSENEVSEVQRVSEIKRLISRWKWLHADQEYQTDMAPTEDEAERLIAIHNDDKIKSGIGWPSWFRRRFRKSMICWNS